MASSIESLLEDISGVADNPIEQLRNLKTAISSVPASGLRDIVARDGGRWLDAIFSLLSTDDGEQIELCADILRHVLPALSPAHAARTLRSELRAGLVHPAAAVRTLALTQVSRMTGDGEAAAELLRNHEVDVLREVVRCVGAEEMCVAKEAVGSLVKLSRSTEGGLEALFSQGGSLLDGLKEVMALGDVPRCRVYELAIDVASASAEALGRCAESGVLSRLLDELTGDDVLIRATAVGMVTTLAHSRHGRQFLALHGVMDKFSGMIRGADASGGFSSLYLPGLVTFFGTLAAAEGPRRVCERYPAFRDKVLEMAMGSDPAMTGVALDTLGLLGSDAEGKRVLQGSSAERFAAVLSRMGRLAMASGATEMRVRCLESVARLLGLREQQPDLLALTESWFRLMADDPMDAMAKVAAQPFPELSRAALRVLAAVAPQPWAQRAMLGTPGFMEFVVDRATGRTKEVKDAKFQLVKALADSSTAASVLGGQHYLHLKSYLREGPYHVLAAGAAVATEEAE